MTYGRVEKATQGAEGPRWFLPLVVANLMAAVGAYMELAGGSWDVATHVLRGGLGTDDFWTPPHMVLYSGVGLLGLGALAALPLTLLPSMRAPAHLVLGLRLALLGALLQGLAGGFDQWWHATRGPDVVLFSPPHALLIMGMAINATAMVLSLARLRTLLRTRGLGGQGLRSWPFLLQAVTLTTMWVALNAQAYLFTDIEGYLYTFGVDLAPYQLPLLVASSLAVATFGTLILLLADRLLGPPGPTLVALTMASTMTLATLVPLGEWTFIPVYLAFVLPVALVDLFGERLGRLRAPVMAPMAFALDGWLSSALLPGIAENPWVALLVALTMAAGALAFFLARPLVRLFLGSPTPSAP